MATNLNQPAPSRRLNLSIDYRIITIVLLAVIAGMLALWRPWTSAQTSDRTIQVTGQTTLKAEPDEYIFYPAYEFKNKDRNAALAELSKKSDEVVAKLKSLGVSDSKIKVNSDGYEPYYLEKTPGTTTYTLRLTVVVDNRELAQKVQDYLVTTTPTGTVSPQADFSDARRKELENQARDEATKDARAKADQTAKNLGFKLGKVKAVSDGSGFGDVIPYDGRLEAAIDSSASTKLAVQPGENELSYSITVTYFVK